MTSSLAELNFTDLSASLSSLSENTATALRLLRFLGCQARHPARPQSLALLVTGVAGFVGTHSFLALPERGDGVLGFDNFSSSYDPSLKRARQELLSPHQIFIVEGDLTATQYTQQPSTLWPFLPPRMGRPLPELRVSLNDLPGHDFNYFFEPLPEFYSKLPEAKGGCFHRCFISGMPGSFYGRLFPKQ